MADYDSLRKLAEAVVNDLSDAGKALATAESCTGGWIAKSITDVAGSSAVFGYGIVSYSNGAKESLLGVRSETLEEHGAVSEPVARQMAAGVRVRLNADLGIATTGIAGPGGGTPEKPVGTVHVAASVGDRVQAEAWRFSGDREAVRVRSAQAALTLLLRMIREAE